MRRSETVVIHQPNLLPRLRVFCKIAQSTTWVVLDNVQYVRREWQNRTSLRFSRCPWRTYWLTAPVQYAPQSTHISDILLHDHGAFRSKVNAALTHSYGSSPHYEWLCAFVDNWLSMDYKSLLDLSEASTTVALEMLEISPRVIRASTMGVLENERSTRLLALSTSCAATTYLCGRGGRRYLNQEIFIQAGIGVTYQEMPDNLIHFADYSFLDYVAHHGPEALKQLHQ